MLDYQTTNTGGSRPQTFDNVDFLELDKKDQHCSGFRRVHVDEYTASSALIEKA